MEASFVLKLFGTLASAAAAWWGFRRFQLVIAAYRESVGPRAAKPSTKLVFGWVGALREAKSPSLTLRVGNQERRVIILEGAEWSVPHLRLKWNADLGTNSNRQLGEGEGITLELDPRLALEMLQGTPRLRKWHNRLLVICDLRLVLNLQSGESLALRTPGAMRMFLAFEQGLTVPARALVRLHAFARP